MKKLHKLNLLETIVFAIGFTAIICALTIWWGHFIKVHEYIIIW
jgi:hypothetical protein